MVAYLRDETGIVELTWFKGISWMEKILKEGEAYTAFGRVSFFSGNPQIVHPEVELKDFDLLLFETVVLLLYFLP